RSDNAPTLYTAEQFITFIFHSISGAHRRSFSISSAPCCDTELTFTVKKHIHGNYSRYLIDKAIVCETLYCAGISGLFTLPDNIAAYHQMFFIAAGSGIAPIFSLIKSVLQLQQHIKINLLYSTKNINETIFY